MLDFGTIKNNCYILTLPRVHYSLSKYQVNQQNWKHQNCEILDLPDMEIGSIQWLQSYFDHMINHMSEFWPFPLTSYHLSELSFDWVFFLQSKLIIILSFSKTFEFQLTGHWHCKHKAVFGSGSTLKFTSFIKILSFDWVGFYWKIPLSFEWVIIWVSYFFRAFGAVLSYDWVIIWPNYDCILYKDRIIL